MIFHYLRIVWNRKKANALILTEILVSFLVLCMVFSVALYYAANWRQPLGFDYQNVWKVSVGIPDRFDNDPDKTARNLATSREILRAMRSHREVQSVAPGGNTPYGNSRTRRGLYMADRHLLAFLDTRTLPECRDVLKLHVTAGRWLEPGDEGLDYTPIVISENLARRIFGRENPLNRTIDEYDENGLPKPPEKAWHELRVVGVVQNFRCAGELTDTPYAAFEPENLNDADRGWAPWSYMIRLDPGTPAAFEEELMKSLHDAAPTWSFDVTTLAQQRESYLRGRLLPLLIGGTLAGFLILMVGMGLLGVLWQNVTRRTQELGLRRALGATAEQVRRQVIGEIVMLTTLALLLGTVLFLQVPLLGMLSFVDFSVFLTAILVAFAVLYPFVILCGLYPGWLATRVDPARALQYE